MQTFTFGTTPEDKIREAFADHARNGGGYAIDARGIDAATLDAATCSDGEWTVDELLGTLHALGTVTSDDAAAALERRGERDRYTVAEIQENADSLRGSILETLGIEEI
jgi:hypothetical protein